MHRILLSLIPILAATIPLIITETSVVAHHAFSAEFDASRPVALRGNITKMEWINPHAWMHLDVTNDDGTVDSWMIEAGPPAAKNWPPKHGPNKRRFGLAQPVAPRTSHLTSAVSRGVSLA